MTDIKTVGLILIIANFAFTYKGLNNRLFFDSYKFEIDKILLNKDYKRLFSSAFLHVNWTHIIFNMFSLYAFSGLLESELGGFLFLLIYVTSLLGGDLLALFVHRQHGDYSSVGASGAVCGIIFASIALFPDLGIGFFGLPFSIPSWIYGIMYVGYSIYGIKSNKDNIGHEAHLGGALIGMALAIAIKPSTLIENYLTILIITIPALIFIYLLITKPKILLIDNTFFSIRKGYYNVEHKYNEKKMNKQKELDKLLEKISKKGIESLSKKEKEKLDQYSK